MGLRIGDDETYKFHPPVPERKRSVRKTLQSRRKNDQHGDDSGRSTKSPASDLKGFIMHIKSGVTSTQSTNYSSLQNTPRGSIGSRPPSQSSFTCSIDEDNNKKWWPGRSHKGKDSNKSGRQTPGFLTRSPSLDVWTGKDHKEPDHHRLPDPTPTNISEPYNFQHHMHVQPHQFAQMANASQNDLVAEFSAIRAAQSARRCLNGVDAGVRCSYMAGTQSVPSSFQVTARSSMHAPEPISPQSEQTAQYKGSKGSFSIPFKDGKSPKLHQHPSTEFQSMMPISDATIVEATTQPGPRAASVRQRDPRSGDLCSHCHSRILETEPPSDSPSELEGTPVEEKPHAERLFSTETMEGLKTGFYASPQERKEEHDFKELHPEPRVRAQFNKEQPRGRPRLLMPLTDADEVRVSMNRSSISGGLFSSWAAASDSSEEGDVVAEQDQMSSFSPQQRIAKRMMQRAARTNAKAKPAYRAPATPPPASPLPQVPQQQLQTSRANTIRHAKIDSHHERNDFAVIEEEEEDSVQGASETSEGSETVVKVLPARRPSIKNVRFKTDDTLINANDYHGPEKETSLDRVQASLNDLNKNLSRLETDLSRGPEEPSKPKRRTSDSYSKHARKPSDSFRETMSSRPKTSDGKATLANSGHRRHRTSSGAAGKPPGRSEANSSRVAASANRPNRANTLGNHPGSPLADSSKLHAPLPPLPPQAKAANDKKQERHYSSGSATIPSSIIVR